VLVLYLFFYTDVAFLLYNIAGCAAVIVVALVVQFISDKSSGIRPTA
jgi:hypothetical protein